MSHSQFLAGDLAFNNFGVPLHPFDTAEDAWLWCVKTSDAIHGGGYVPTTGGILPRPCEAVDIQTVVLRLAHQRALTDAQINVLALYGKRQSRPKKPADSALWRQAMRRMTPILQHKGIIV